MSASPGAVAAVARLVPATRSTRPRLSSGTRTGSRASSGEGCLGMSLHYHGLSLLWRTSGLVALQEEMRENLVLQFSRTHSSILSRLFLAVDRDEMKDT